MNGDTSVLTSCLHEAALPALTTLFVSQRQKQLWWEVVGSGWNGLDRFDANRHTRFFAASLRDGAVGAESLNSAIIKWLLCEIQKFGGEM